MKKKIISILLILLVIVSCFLFNKKQDEEVIEVYTVAIKEISKRGNVLLDTSYDELKDKNIDLADIITVSFGDISVDMPFGVNYTDINFGEPMLRKDPDDGVVGLVVNGDSFAGKYNVATKKEINEEPGYKWDLYYDSITITLKEKEGYLEEYTIRNLERFNDRDKYPELDDRSFANYRSVGTTGIKENILYRGTTPLDDTISRNEYVMSFIEEDGIKTIINLANSEDEINKDIFENSYYSTCNVYFASMAYDYNSQDFKQKVKECIEFINENDGPYYIHCKEGKDRTGFVCALIECYMGATYEEVIDDYMKTYINFYKVEKDSETYNATIKNNIQKMLCDAFEVKDLKAASLSDEAKDYLLSTGLSLDSLNKLKEKLG